MKLMTDRHYRQKLVALLDKKDAIDCDGCICISNVILRSKMMCE
jgi:hypothetical protein